MAADDSFELRCQKQKIAFFAPVGLALSLALFDQLRWEFEKGALVGKGGGKIQKSKGGAKFSFSLRQFYSSEKRKINYSVMD